MRSRTVSWSVACTSRATKREKHTTLGAQLEHQVGANINRPDIIVGIDADSMRADKEIVCNTANKSATHIKFHKWVLAAVEYIDVALRIDSNASGFNKVLARWQLEKFGPSFVGKPEYRRREVLCYRSTAK